MISNSRFEVLTDSGFSDFSGVRIGVSEKSCLIKFDDSSSLGCTLDHQIYHKEKFISAKSVRPGYNLNGKTVVSIRLIQSSRMVYDLVDVEALSRYVTNGVISHNCSFVGSSNTLVKGEKIAALAIRQAITTSLDGFVAYEAPQKKSSYVMTVDVAEGKEMDSSAFVIFDISTLPYKVVATYKNNAINTLAYPEVLHHYAKMYNDAFVLVESNSLGQQVADALFYDIEYENMYMSNKEDVIDGFGGSARPGIKTTKKTKAIGCNAIKAIIENDNMDVGSADIIDEMSTFVRSGSTYKAEEGKHDDLMMCMVTFGFLTQTTAFKNLFDFYLRKEFIKQQLHQIESDELPLGYFSDGRDEERDMTFF